ncbi:MAG: hypothetical protein AB7P08_09505 [Burkholderiales bacterium]
MDKLGTAKRRKKEDDDSGGSHFDVTCEPKLIEYLEELIELQGFGNSKSAIARQFIWKEVNRLIEAGRLPQR